ncbi:MAG: MCE family protein [Betaproteobacteria bacterium]|nr:MCE family protein [Betaproteobacteria bacterium]
METDKRYFIAGLFIILLAAGIATAFVWLAGSERRDDVRYDVRFTESVSGLALGESVKYRGVDVGNVKSMVLDPADPRLVLVNVSVRKDAPVKTDTRATLKLKGVTGAMFIELNGGNPKAELLLATTPAGEVPVIASEKSSLATVVDQLPRVVEKFSAIEDQAKKVLNDVSGFTSKVKDNPSLLLRRPEKDKQPASGEVKN